MKAALRPTLALVALSTTLALAEMPPPDTPRPRIDIAAVLNIDAARAAKVEAILQATHERVRALREQVGPPTDEATRQQMHAVMRAIHEEADQQLLTVLSADELERLKASLPPPGPGPWRRG